MPELIRQCPQGKEFPWKPHTGQSYHSTSNTFMPASLSPALRLCETHTHKPSLSLSLTHALLVSIALSVNLSSNNTQICRYTSAYSRCTHAQTHTHRPANQHQSDRLSRPLSLPSSSQTNPKKWQHIQFQWKNVKEHFLTATIWALTTSTVMVAMLVINTMKFHDQNQDSLFG